MPKPTSRKDFEAIIVANAWKDPRYLRRLKADPNGVLQGELETLYKGATLPPGLTVHVHEEGPNDVHLVLPSNPQDFTAQEISDEDLDRVAGGTGIGVVVNAVQTGIVNSNVNTLQVINIDVVTTVIDQGVVTQVALIGTTTVGTAK